MPLTAEMRQGIDRIRDYLYGGGYPDPVNNAEQLSYLFFFYLMEGIDRDNLLRARATGQDYASVFSGTWTLNNPLNALNRGEMAVKQHPILTRCQRPILTT
jgi:type I restriction enzyme M protein